MNLLLAGTALLATALAATGWAGFRLAEVYRYAELSGEPRLQRDPVEPERLILTYQPSTGGTIAFGRADADRQTELLERVAGSEVGQPHNFQWRVGGVQPGDVIRVVSRSGLSLVTRVLPVPQPAGPSGGEGTLSGQVINAINKQPVPGAEIRIPGGSLSAKADTQGRFRLEHAPLGEVPVEISADGFSSEQMQATLIAGHDDPLRVVLSPGMPQGQMRIVLTWGKEPKDLDAHLEGPLPDGTRFHVYYHNQGDLKSKEFVRLDVDAQDGEGPETITVLGVAPGQYRFFVHDYTHRDDPNSTALADSGAEVRVFQGGQTYRYHAGHEMKGNVWNVFTMNVASTGAVVNKVDRYESKGSAELGLYAKRTAANRQEWIADLGGSKASETAVDEGLAWLARHQALDGRWSMHNLGHDPFTRCEHGDACTQPGSVYDVAHSGLAVLAFQAGGNYYFNHHLYSDVVRNGLDWLVEHQYATGALVTDVPNSNVKTKKLTVQERAQRRMHNDQNYMYEHGIATFALADACAAAKASGSAADEKYLAALRKAVTFIYSQQHHDGGWRYNANGNEDSDTSVTGWQVLALKSAREAGLDVNPQVIARVRAFFSARDTHQHGRTAYLNGTVHTEATTGVGMLAHQFLLGDPETPLVHQAATWLADQAERRWGDHSSAAGVDYYLWYNCTLAMFQAGGEEWKTWNDAVRDTILNLQEHRGCTRGSWSPNDQWGDRGGRIYSTALAILTLETYYRYTAPQDRQAPAATATAVPVVNTAPKSATAPVISIQPDTQGLEATGKKKSL